MTQDGKEDSMSHVDEGTLHAYLDGELPPSERAATDAHLAQCATCRGALAEERALLERASVLLGSARPVDRPAPPFEQIRPAAKRSPWRVRTSFAWAASIMLALGLGYYLRDPGSDNAALYRSNETAFVTLSRDSATPAPPPMRASRQESQRRPAAGNKVARPTDEPAREQSRVDAGAAAETAPPAAAGAGAVVIKSTPSLRNVAPAQTLRDSSLRLEEIVVTGAMDRAAVSARRGLAGTTQWQIISRGAATTLLGTDPVGLPGLATRRIRRSPAPDATVVVEQALDSSTVIQIFQRPAMAFGYTDSTGRYYARERAARKAAPAAAPPPADRLARFVGRLRVEISGPLSLDSLNRLLEQVEPLP
jgi:anti-sigma factor RsiW